MKTVLIYEDNRALRESLIELLTVSGEYHVAGAYEECSLVTSHLEEHDPDLILMDIDMPKVSGIDGVKMIRAAGSSVPVIMLTIFEDGPHILDAIRNGASGYLLKKHLTSSLGTALQSVMTEGGYLSPSVARLIMQSMRPNATPSDYHFTKRETEILNLLCKGYSYKMIASELFVSFETVRSHIRNIYDKLQVRSATEAVSKAINEKLI